MNKKFIYKALLTGLMLNTCQAFAIDHALLVGVGVYKNPKANLPGIEKDIDMAQQMSMRMGFLPQNTRILRDQQATLSNMRDSMAWLAQNTQANDRVFIYVSSHGSHIRDRNGDEDDGRDETLYLHDGHLIDDELHILIGKIPSRNIVVVVDACNSGTGTRDLAPNRYRVSNGHIKSWVEKADFSPESGYDMPVEDVLAPALNYTALAAAQDDQQSLASDHGSVFTRALLEVFESARTKHTPISWDAIFGQVKYRMKQMDTSFQPNMDGNPLIAQNFIRFSNINPAPAAYYSAANYQGGASPVMTAARTQPVTSAIPIQQSSSVSAVSSTITIRPALSSNPVIITPAKPSIQPVNTMPTLSTNPVLISPAQPLQPPVILASNLSSGSTNNTMQPSKPMSVASIAPSTITSSKPAQAMHPVSSAMTPQIEKPLVPVISNSNNVNFLWAEVATLAQQSAKRLAISAPEQLKEEQLLNFSVNVPTAGYLYIVSVGPTDNVTLLFPNEYVEDNKVTAKTVVFPEPGKFVLRAKAPLGKTMLAAFLTPSPINWQDQAFGNKDDTGKVNALFGSLPLSAIRDLARLKNYSAGYREVDIKSK
jgi:hypothetical protein